jgi:PhoPQ-activated pathogenicity-related protein
MNGNELSITNDFIEKILYKFLSKYKKTRVIPQVHKFLDVR